MEDNNNYKLTTELKVSFKRKNKIYNKLIYILMNERMKTNITAYGNVQYFADSKYDCIQPQNRGMKLQ